MIDRWINPEGFSRVRAMRFSAKDEIPLACPADYSALCRWIVICEVLKSSPPILSQFRHQNDEFFRG